VPNWRHMIHLLILVLCGGEGSVRSCCYSCCCCRIVFVYIFLKTIDAPITSSELDLIFHLYICAHAPCRNLVRQYCSDSLVPTICKIGSGVQLFVTWYLSPGVNGLQLLVLICCVKSHICAIFLISERGTSAHHKVLPGRWI
jgi:hypothetical protein